MDKNKTPYKLLKMLADGEFHSGQRLGEQLNMTRSAIWKAIRFLSSLGIEIESITGKGYRVVGGLELLNQELLNSHLNMEAKQHIDEIILLCQVDSTNNYLLAKTHTKRTLACFAEQQTQGKGRRGRTWVSPFGTNIYHSLLWHFAKDPAEIMGLSLALAVTTVNALVAYGIDNDAIGVKWPNDILWNNKKLAGILVEMIASSNETCSVVMGIGINTHMPSLQAKFIDQAWTSLNAITQTKIERNRLAALLLNHLTQALLQFEEQGLEPFLKTWRALDLYSGKKIILHTPKEIIHGTMHGIGDKGELIISANNQLRSFLSGEVSLRLCE